MISPNDFKNGLAFEYEGQLFQIIEFQHVKPGKGPAFVRTKIKNIISGSIIDKTFNPNEKMPEAIIERKDMQYLYADEDLFHFMDVETFEQIPVNADFIGDSLKFIKENDVVKLMFFKSNVIGIEPPIFVNLEVIETEPGFKGDTATGATKPATLETGAVVRVPLFVKKGDVLKVDTRSGDYVERV